MRAFHLIAGAALALAACLPSAPDPLAEAARACESGEGDARIAGCTTLIDAETTEPAARVAAYVSRADALREKGDVTPALRDYEAALGVDAESTTALLGRGAILLASGQLDAASAMIERAAPHDTSGRAQTLLGRIEVTKGNHVAALTHLDAALVQDDGIAEAHALRARVRKASGDLPGARADYSTAIRLDSALAEARAGRCWLSLEANENLEQARDDAEAAVLADARNVDGQICRGVLQLRANEPGDALASFSAALTVEPGNPEALFGHGIARMRTGDSQGARDMNRARDFSAHVGQRYDELGVRTR